MVCATWCMTTMVDEGVVHEGVVHEGVVHEGTCRLLKFRPLAHWHVRTRLRMSEWQRYRYVANEGTLHLDHIYLDVMRSVIKKLWKL